MSRRRGAVASPKDDWQTPKWLLDALRKELGRIWLDPCSAPSNPTDALMYAWEGGLELDWGCPWRHSRTQYLDANAEIADHGWVFINPPFSQASAWVEKVLLPDLAFGGTEKVLLLPASVNSKRFRALTTHTDVVAFFGRRVSYVDPATGEEMRGADFDSAAWYFGHRPWAFVKALKPYATMCGRKMGIVAQEAS